MERERIILHSDMNCFYASVETMLHPELRDKPVAVCGSTESRHGIILAKSEKAKQAGVKTGMVNWEARQLCPDIIMVAPHYDQYLKCSKAAHEIYYRYTDKVEPFGMDECWLDVTASGHYGSGVKIAEEIRSACRNELGLTVSVGVSFNKIFAKLGSDMKKPDAMTVITKDNFREKVWPLPASELIYAGRSTCKRLDAYGIKTIGQLAGASPDFLKWLLGINGLKLHTYANGLDASNVCHKDFESPIKSIGHGITCTADLNNNDEVFRVMLELSQDVGHRLRVHDLAARGVQISIRNHDLTGRQFQGKLQLKTQLPSEIAAEGFRLFKKNYRWDNKVRALCIRAINLVPANEADQLTVFTDIDSLIKNERLQDTVEEIRRRFGKAAVNYAALIGDLKMPFDNRHLVRMPKPIA